MNVTLFAFYSIFGFFARNVRGCLPWLALVEGMLFTLFVSMGATLVMDREAIRIEQFEELVLFGSFIGLILHMTFFWFHGYDDRETYPAVTERYHPLVHFTPAEPSSGSPEIIPCSEIVGEQ
ncbi:hypothetical protein GCK72_002965 [Caenorhabditis remanei]|uniref:Uncharacterized protein n=1 Tax=Caenorhabditis remanei TaxID=31234 RepID=A0A6A5HSH5_CAERE|nr:hypothetical protein GCK72_002965 [Caenorhabditis remanei]KAF1771140.1 hypothetical protein GCK72_002965 [Caenorhabditis remanei]